ncbi:MAG: hypothetical protein JWR80_3925 [Bradyrhizobium sp.]|nr:hypothetical protein [Bradyrhizobium sp.]
MPQRSPNGHQILVKQFPFFARMRREEAFKSADNAEWKAAADRIAGPDRWDSMAGWKPADVDCKLIGFAAQAEADEMQRWIAASGIETRPAPPKYTGPMLTVGSYNKDGQEQN